MKQQEFILTYGSESLTLDDNPDGWSRNGQSWERNKPLHGVFQSKTIDTFRFTRSAIGGGDFIYDAYLIDDLKTVIIVDVYDYNPQTGGYDISYSGLLNFEVDELRIERDFIEIGFIQSSNIQDFLTRNELDIDVRQNESVDGVTVSDVDTSTITYKAINIYSYAESDGDQDGEVIHDQYSAASVAIYYSEIQEIANEISDRYQLNSGGATIYENDLSTVSEINIGFKAISNDSEVFLERTSDLAPYALIRIDFRLVLKDSLGAVVSNQSIYQQDVGQVVPSGGITLPVPIAISDADLNHVYYTLSVPVGGTVEFYTLVSKLSINNAKATYTQDLPMNIRIQEKSTSVGDSDVSGYFPEEIFTKLFRLYTSSEDIFYSEFFGKVASTLQSYSEDGTGAFVHTTTGYNLRQFPDKQFVVNFMDYFMTLNSIYNLMCGYDYTNNRFFIEQKSAAYDAETILFDLGEITDELIITPYKDAYYNEISGGYEEDGDYEQFQGTGEFNLNSNYSIDQPVKNKLKIRAKYNTDSMTAESARRYPYTNYASTDTKQDDKIVLVNSDGNETIQGGEDLAGVAGIEERYNIAFTPRENLIRWGNFIKSGLWKEGTFTIKFTSAKKSVNITYKNQNGEIVNEFDNISSSELPDLRLFNPQYLGFKSIFGLDKAEAIKANPHGLINFSFNGEALSGFIDQIQSQNYNKQATYKLIGYIPQNAEMIWDDETEINAIFEDEQQIIFD